MKKSARILALIMAMLLASSSMISCSDNSANEEPEETAVTEQAEASAEIVGEEDDSTHYFDDMEAVDYNGYAFNISNGAPDATWFRPLLVEELTGEVFNDDIYNRQLAVEEKFNIKLSESYTGAHTVFEASVTAGTGDIDIGYPVVVNCMGLILKGCCLDYNAMPAINLSNPYWDQGAREMLTIYDQYYFGYCDIGWDHYESMSTLFYNGYLLEDAGITESPYDLYKENRWTMEAMYNMMTSVAKDVNGDGEMNIRDDVFGYAGREFEYLPCLYASGSRLIKYDSANDTYVMSISTEDVVAVGEMSDKIFNDTNLSILGGSDDSRTLFKSGNLLFYSQLLGDFRNLRDQEDDYGLICYPSLNEGEISAVFVQDPSCVIAASDTKDADRTGTIIEALAAYTYDNILEDYVEKAVIGKGTRDEQSAEVLRELITKRAFDFSQAFDAETLVAGVYVSGVKKDTYASLETRNAKMFDKYIDKVVSYYKKHAQ